MLGKVVPENQFALIGVRGNTAHVAYLDLEQLEISGQRCADPRRARVVKQASQDGFVHAKLKEIK